MSAGLYNLPDDVLRALATFLPMSHLLMLVRCSRHLQIVLQIQLTLGLDQLFVTTYLEYYYYRERRLPLNAIIYQPEQRVLHTLFGEADVRGGSNVYCFVEAEGKSVLSLIHRKFVDIHLEAGATAQIENENDYATRDRFVSWLRYRCEQQLATEARGNTTDVIGGVTSDLGERA
jgi:hypothetical protein